MESVIPSSAGDSFDVEWQITDDGELRKATLTGVFYPQTEPMTYTVDFADYGTEKDIRRRERDRAGLAQLDPAPRHRRRRGRLRGCRHLRRRPRAAGHDDRRRRPDRPAAAGGTDRQRLPSRLRRHAATDRQDRRPPRPGARAGDGAGALRPGLADHHRRLRHAQHRDRPLPPGCRGRRPGAGDPGPRGRPLPGRSARCPVGRGLGRAGDRLGGRTALRRVGPGRRRLARDLRHQLRGRADPGGGDPRPGGWCASRHGPSRPVPSGPGRPPAPDRDRRGRRHRLPAPTRPPTRPDVGVALRAVHGRRPVADADRRHRRRRARAAAGLVLVRPTPAPRPARVGRGAARGRPRRRAAARCRPGRGDPGFRDRRSQDRGLLATRPVVPPRSRGGRGGLHLAPAPCSPAPRAAGGPPSYAGVGGVAGQLLHRCRADRRPHRHPALRAHHGLSGRPAPGGARAGALPDRVAGGRGARRLRRSGASPPVSSPRSGCCSRPPASCS